MVAVIRVKSKMDTHALVALLQVKMHALRRNVEMGIRQNLRSAMTATPYQVTAAIRTAEWKPVMGVLYQ